MSEPAPGGFFVPPGFWDAMQRIEDEVTRAAGNAMDGLGDLLIPEKLAMRLDIPEALLMDCGVIPDTREHKPAPWRTRLRWRWQAARGRLAERADEFIAGYELPGGDE